MDIDEVLSKHLAWKTKFIHAAYSGRPMNPAEIEQDNWCETGKWMQGEGKIKYGHLPSYETCLKRHAEFHIEAGKILSALRAKHFTEAKGLLQLDSGFSLAALGLWNGFVELKNEVNRTMP
jgi:methyl-accepting chemotaxis protein